MQWLHLMYSKTCVKRPLSKSPKIVYQNQLSFNAGQKYYNMLQGHSAVLSIFINMIKLPFVIEIFVLSLLNYRFTHVLLHCCILWRKISTLQDKQHDASTITIGIKRFKVSIEIMQLNVF